MEAFWWQVATLHLCLRHRHFPPITESTSYQALTLALSQCWAWIGVRERWERQRTSYGSGRLGRCSEGPICECKKALTALLCPAKFLGVTSGVSLNHFLPFLRGSPILVRSDNFTLVAYINLQGGPHFPRLHKLTRSIIIWSCVCLWVTQVRGRGTGLL